MGWIAVYKDGHMEREEDNIGRPMAAGEAGELLAIAQEDFGHSVAVDLINGVIALDYDTPLSLSSDGKVVIDNFRSLIWILEGETNIVGEYKNIDPIFEPWYRCKEGQSCDQGSTNKDEPCAKGHPRLPVVDATGEAICVRTDYVTPITWRPIWFTRMTNGVPTKVIGAQTTAPEPFGGHNVKMMVSLFVDGRVGISG